MAEAAKEALAPRRILLATDLSARCDRALDRAALLSRQWGSGLLALHVLEDAEAMIAWHNARGVHSWQRPSDVLQRVERDVRHCLLHRPAEISTVVEEGRPAEVIARIAAEHGSELIVTGTARSEPLGRWFVGSTVDRLVQSAPAPILVVRSRANAPYSRILVATDFSDPSRQALKRTLAWFADTPVTLFNAYDVPLSGLAIDPDRLRRGYETAIAEDAAAFLEASGLTADERKRIGVELESGPPERVLVDYVGTRGFELIVIATHGRSALFNVLIGSTAKAILARVPCDALVVRGSPAQ